MSRFSTPDEIFGPVSISKLKETDSYERCVEGYLPTADVAFLDEMWKAGPAIQNTLLTVMNEKLFRNGSHELHLPLKLLVAASNELPAQGEGLEALWDRFIIRLECRNISNDQLFLEMLTTPNDPVIEMNADDQISNEEYEKWSREIDDISISQPVLDAIIAIRKSLRSVRVDADSELRNIYVSDRRGRISSDCSAHQPFCRTVRTQNLRTWCQCIIVFGRSLRSEMPCVRSSYSRSSRLMPTGWQN